MTTPIPISNPTSDAESTAPGITIIYEDRMSGLRAKRFSDMLTVSLGCQSNATPACWRGELLGLPQIFEESARDATGSEFVILSLRGDTSLSVAMKVWLESWLKGAAGGPSSLVALFDPERSVASHAGSARAYLRHAAASAGVAFFAHCTATTAGEADEFFLEEDEPAAKRPARRGSRNAIASFFPTAVAA